MQSRERGLYERFPSLLRRCERLGFLRFPTNMITPPIITIPTTDPPKLLEFTGGDQIVSGNNIPSSKSFKLLDLPREIRDLIYRAMLCDWKKGAIGHIQVSGDVRFDPLRDDIEPNILLANKQIYQEAKLVLLKDNQFVHISMDVSHRDVLSDIFVQYNVPVVSAKRACWRRAQGSVMPDLGGYTRGSLKPGCADIFKNLVVMTYYVQFCKDPRARLKKWDRFDFILLRRDLQHFCKAVAFLDILGPYSTYSKHLVIMRNPFAETLSPDFLNYKNQESLLEPYCKEFEGFGHFKIEGHVQPDLAEKVVGTIMKEPTLPDPDTFLGDLLSQKDLGDQAFSDGERDEADMFWKSAYGAVLLVLNRSMWPRLKEAGGKDFTYSVTELAFEIQTSQAESFLVAMRGLPLQIQIIRSRGPPGRPEEAYKLRQLQGRLVHLGGKMREACSTAEHMGPFLGTDWAPSNEQQAKLYYRLAQGLRLVGHDHSLHDAEENIDRASELLPDDAEIESEAQQIRVWKARVQGG